VAGERRGFITLAETTLIRRNAIKFEHSAPAGILGKIIITKLHLLTRYLLLF
jgi:hypothetical protein